MGAARMGEKTAARITGTACERAKMYRRLPSLLCRRFPNRRGMDLSEMIDTTHGPQAEALRHSGLGSPRYVIHSHPIAAQKKLEPRYLVSYKRMRVHQKFHQPPRAAASKPLVIHASSFTSTRHCIPAANRVPSARSFV